MTHLPALLTSLFLPLALASTALAAAPPVLDYQAPAGCPDSGSFVLAVEGRGASFAPAEAEPRRLLVRIEPAGSGFTGSLTVQLGARASEPRQVQGKSCAEVSDALAVVTAIALQRDAQAPAAAPAPPPPAPAPALALPPRPPPLELSEPGSLELVMGRKDVVVPPGKLVLDFVSTHTVAAGVQLGAIPGVVLPRLDYSISRANTVTAPDGRAFMLGNEFRVRWTLLGATQHRAPGHETSIFGLKAGIGACTPLWKDVARLTLKVCSEIAAGAMNLETRAAATGWKRQQTVGLATASSELELHYNVSRLFHLDLRAGAEVWLSRISAEREDGSRLFQSPFFNGYALIGIGIHF